MHERNAPKVVSLCRHNGGVYVKAGQLASQLSDVPRAYRDACATLQDRAVWRPYHEVASMLRAHALLGALAHIEEEPVAAASLAQVRRQCGYRLGWGGT